MIPSRLNSARLGSLTRPILSKKFLSQAAPSTSLEPMGETSKEKEHKDLKSFETLKNIQRKTRVKKPQRPPFVKNLLLGKFDTEILTFPQLEKDEVENLERDAVQIEKLVKQKHMITVDKFSNKNFRQNLSDYRAIGLQASQFLDGRELGCIESSRILESLSEHNLRESIIFNEQFFVQSLVKFGNEQLKKRCLHPVIKAEKVGAFCFAEETMSDFNSINTKASLSDDQKCWLLNGAKSWVVNGFSADYYVVLAVTKVIQRDIQQDIKLTAFLVDSDAPGVSRQKIDNCGMEMARVTFEGTPVLVENVIGEVDQGESLLKSVISDFRLSAGPSCITLCKQLTTKLHDSIVAQVTEKNPLHETDAIKSKVGEMMVNIFAMEAVTYLTAGLQDWYENQDLVVESSIVKAFCSQQAYDISSTCLDLIGMPAVVETHWARELHQACINYMTLNETNESQKMIISLFCLQHAGQILGEKIRLNRNPALHAAHTIARNIKNRRQLKDNPSLDLKLIEYLHPSLEPASRQLEYCVKRLEWAAEGLLSKYGLDVVNKHIDLRRLADAIIYTYVATACLARASRSYCIGLQNAESELIMTNAFCYTAEKKVRAYIMDICLSSVQKNDDLYDFVAKRFFTYKGYYLKHPTARNF